MLRIHAEPHRRMAPASERKLPNAWLEGRFPCILHSEDHADQRLFGANRDDRERCNSLGGASVIPSAQLELAALARLGAVAAGSGDCGRTIVGTMPRSRSGPSTSVSLSRTRETSFRGLSLGVSSATMRACLTSARIRRCRRIMKKTTMPMDNINTADTTAKGTFMSTRVPDGCDSVDGADEILVDVDCSADAVKESAGLDVAKVVDILT